MPYLVANKMPGTVSLRDGTGHHMLQRAVGYEPVLFYYRPVIDPRRESCEEVTPNKRDQERLEAQIKECNLDLKVAQFMRGQGDKEPMSRILGRIRGDRKTALALYNAHQKVQVELAKPPAKSEPAKPEGNKGDGR